MSNERRVTKSTNLVGIPGPDEVGWDRAEALGEDFPVGPSGVVPESLSLVSKGVGNHLVLDSSDFVVVSNWGGTHEVGNSFSALTPLWLDEAEMF